MSPRRGACLVDTLLRRLNLFKPKLRFLTLGVFQEGRADCSQTPLGRVDTCGIEDILSRTTSARMREASRGKSLPHHIFMYVYIYIYSIYINALLLSRKVPASMSTIGLPPNATLYDAVAQY